LIGIEDMPKVELAWKYVYGKPLIRPEQIRLLPTQMCKLQKWYEQVTEEGRQFLMVSIKEEHFYHEDAVAIEMAELFQLFSQDTLEKSLLCCYYL
jgi:hypothetical protein